jgi:hypothetical protein
MIASSHFPLAAFKFKPAAGEQVIKSFLFATKTLSFISSCPSCLRGDNLLNFLLCLLLTKTY